jgi:hypothetical protein
MGSGSILDMGSLPDCCVKEQLETPAMDIVSWSKEPLGPPVMDIVS